MNKLAWLIKAGGMWLVCGQYCICVRIVVSKEDYVADKWSVKMWEWPWYVVGSTCYLSSCLFEVKNESSALGGSQKSVVSMWSVCGWQTRSTCSLDHMLQPSFTTYHLLYGNSEQVNLVSMWLVNQINLFTSYNIPSFSVFKYTLSLKNNIPLSS